ncbi:NADH-quinone oxidoreductase subunit C [Paenibacillus sp. LMG 31461]|uniref:NADH-quinone oxidoreductase subunit C n=1 Tax=Paenibacillus plantarum TaxID=2654975 RepID=A0ABX1XEB5_9BACL|nr:NADH-quinone oxidoreductase subunit C [Paenibacillus plantarum]
MSEENKPEETTVPTPPVGEDGKEEGKAGSAADGSVESKPVGSDSVGAENPPVENKPEGSSESKTEASVPPTGASTPATDAAAERAAARAARLAARAAAEAGEPAPAGAATPASADAGSDEEKAAKAQAAAEARAARAAARGAKPESADPAAPKEPSPNQPLLDRLVAILKAEAGEDAVVESFINERDAHRPYVIIHSSRWPQAALTLRNHEELRCDYLRNLSGVDQETHLEVAYHLLSLTHKHEYCVKVKTDREQPSIPSVADVWPTANWNEREAFDLFGIDFPGHPNLVRIMMPDDWVGHPLRKDYEPLDPEV